MAKLQRIEQEAPEQESGVDEIVVGAVGQSVSDLDAMFDDLEAGLGETLVIEGMQTGVAEVPSEDHMIEAGKAVTNDELRKMALEEINATSEHHPEDAKMPEAQTKKRAAPQTKRISTAGMAKSEALAVSLGDKLDDLLTLDTTDLALSDEERFDKRLALLELIDTKMPKKIGEKAINLFAHVSKGAALSNYTRIAINFLLTNGEMTSKQLKDTYLSRPYSEGTSSSQTTQLMNLLPTLGIAKKEAGKLVVNPTSTLFPLLTSIKSAEAGGVAEDDAE
jgi:hypothetical protein